MIYLEYEKYKKEYYETQKIYNEILNEKERLFLITQPKATKYDKEIVSGGKADNKFDNYLIQSERKKIDSRLKEVEEILDKRRILFLSKEKDLRESKEVEDIIYVLRYIDKLKIHKVCYMSHYGEAQVYRILKNIRENIGR